LQQHAGFLALAALARLSQDTPRPPPLACRSLPAPQINVRQLSDLTRLVRGELLPLHRRVLAALITIDVHARDIVDTLHAGKVGDTNDFNWQMQLRYYFENEDLVVRQVRSAATLSREASRGQDA
jgi:hypothetical protein